MSSTVWKNPQPEVKHLSEVKPHTSGGDADRRSSGHWEVKGIGKAPGNISPSSFSL